ncbi:MAG: hypothetical protein AAF333_04120 [Planctomycetota bacterium]
MNDQMFQSVLDAGAASLKTLLIIHGGASTACLALLSNSKANDFSPAWIASGLSFFCLGLLLTFGATACMYFAQYAFHDTDLSAPDAAPSKKGHGWRKGCITLGTIGALAFVPGVVCVATGVWP